MGLGDYYLRMIKWKEENKKTTTVSANYDNLALEINFLGIPYVNGYQAVQKSDLVNKEYLLTLVKNDMSFADVYFVLGDVYFAEKDMQLAIRAYYRAISLGHPRRDIAKKRINEVIAYWEKNNTATHVVMEIRYIRQQINEEIFAAEEWLVQFQAIEKQQIDGDGDLSFAALLKLSQEKPAVKEVGYFKGTSSEGGFVGPSLKDLIIMAVSCIVIFASIFICAIILYKRYKKKKLQTL